MKVPQFMPYLDSSDYESIKSCFDQNWITEGPKSKEFIERLKELIGVKHAVLAPNGTLSIYLGLRAMGIGRGDEVLVPAFTFIASANAVEMCGAKPVFVDINEYLHMNMKSAKSKLTRRTKAIMPVHIYGMACNMDEIQDFATKHNIDIIEDAAQGINVHWKGKHTGSFGKIGSFSFFADKTITTGEGGLVVTNDDDIYEQLLYLRNQGRINRGSFIHPVIGYNFRMTDIQSAIGLNQLSKLPEIVKRKLNILSWYKELLTNRVKIILPEKGSDHVPFRVSILISGGSEKMLEIFEKSGIEGRTFFYPLHMQPAYKEKNSFFRRSKSTYPVAEEMYKNGLCLPSYVSISRSEVEYVCEIINENV